MPKEHSVGMLKGVPSNSEAAGHSLSETRNRLKILQWAFNKIDEQRLDEREKVRGALKVANVPVSEELIRKLARLAPSDLHSILVDHPGFEIWERIESYRISRHIFESAATDLLSTISRFEKEINDGILEYVRNDALDQIKHAIQKELFAATNAAHSLVDHSRRLQRCVSISGYGEKLSEYFGADNLHEFVISLRTILHHLYVIKTGYRLEGRFSDNERFSCTLPTDRVRLVVDQLGDKFTQTQREKIAEFLKLAPNWIDIKNVFEEYKRRVARFHTWYEEKLSSNDLVTLRDCERCLCVNKNYHRNLEWKAMIGNWLNWDQPPNPYNHLHRFLTPVQIAEVYELPMQSNEQVDRIIEFLDAEGACDADLREMAYGLFRRVKLAT